MASMFRHSLAVCLAIVITCSLAGCRPAPSTPIYANPGDLAGVISTMREAAGNPDRALAIEISPYRLSMQVQDKAKPSHIDEYVFERSRGRRGIIYWDIISGPQPITPPLIDKSLEANLFPLDDVDFSALDRLMAEALKKAALDDPSHISGIEIRRIVTLLPSPKAGDVRLTLRVTSGRESANIFADAGAEIVGVDLHDTNRAKTLNLFSNAGERGTGLAMLRSVLEDAPVVLALEIGVQSMELQTNTPELQTNMASRGPIPGNAAFLWTLDGVRSKQNIIPALPEPSEQGAPFRLSEIDERVMSNLISSAPAALRLEDGIVTEVRVTKPQNRPGAAELAHEVRVEGSNGKSGRLFASKDGQITSMVSPNIPRDYFAPGAFSVVIDEIVAAFGRDVKLVQLSIWKDQITATIADPKRAGAPAVYTLDEEGFELDGMPSGLIRDFTTFSLADIQALTPDHVARLTERSLGTLKVHASVLSTITIGRNGLHPSPKGNLTIEFRSNDPRTFKIGLVNYELDGTVVHVEMP